MSKNDPAHPVLAESCQRVNETEYWPGLTKLEVFAKAIAAGMWSNPGLIDTWDESAINAVTAKAVDAAEALLAELEKRT